MANSILRIKPVSIDQINICKTLRCAGYNKKAKSNHTFEWVKKSSKLPNIQIIVPDDATLLEISQLSQAQHLHLITDGTRSVLSPVVPKGWSILLNHNSRNAQLLNQKLNQAAA